MSELDLVIAAGGDGTFLDAAALNLNVPILGINTDPDRSRGFFATAKANTLAKMLNEVNGGKKTTLPRMKVCVEGVEYGPPVLNDVLFAHVNPAATTRYAVARKPYYFQNSGLLVATASGSSAWIHEENGMIMSLDDRRLQILHRGTREARPQFVEAIEIESMTREAALFLDGSHRSLPLGIGRRFSLQPGPDLTVVGDLLPKRRTS